MAEVAKVAPPALGRAVESLGANELGQSKPVSRWVKVCEEIQETEARYSDFLEILVHHFMPPMLAALRADAARSRAIFGNVEQLLAFSTEFQRGLGEALVVGRVGELYKRIAPYYRLYSEYCSNHAEAVQLVTQLSLENPNFGSVVRSCEHSHGQGQTLLSLLIMPIQRVPRHILLLQQLCKALPPENGDLDDCHEALEQMESVGMQINESIRKKENAVKVWEVQNSLVYDTARDDIEPELSPSSPGGGSSEKVHLFETQRVFVREGELFKVCSRKYKKRRKFFLFNDCLIYARPAAAMGLRGGRKKWHFRGMLRVHNVEDLPNGSPLAHGASDAFQIEAASRTLVCVAESTEDKLAWINALRENLMERPPDSKPSLLDEVFGDTTEEKDEDRQGLAISIAEHCKEERTGIANEMGCDESLGIVRTSGDSDDSRRAFRRRSGGFRRIEIGDIDDAKSLAMSPTTTQSSPAEDQWDVQMRVNRERLFAALRAQSLMQWALSHRGYMQRGFAVAGALGTMLVQEILDGRDSVRELCGRTSSENLNSLAVGSRSMLARRATSVSATTHLAWSSRRLLVYLAGVAFIMAWNETRETIAEVKRVDFASLQKGVESATLSCRNACERVGDAIRGAVNGPPASK